jgi:LPS-assembly protein
MRIVELISLAPARPLRQAMLAGAALSVLAAAPVRADEPAADDPVYLEAQSVVGKDGRYVASGEVEIRRQDRVLRAGAVDYDSKANVIEATGDVRLYQPDGTAAFADRVIFDDELTQGVANGFSARLPQNGKLAAANAIVASDTRTEMNRAIFTTCDTCREDGSEKAPSWSISAERIVRDEEDQAIYYRNAVIRIKDVPVLYLPVFSQADPAAERKSGLLAPRIQHTARRGLSYEQPYLWSISPYQDLIISPQINTEVRPLLNLEWRKRFYSGMIQARVGYAYDRDFNSEGVKFGPDKAKAYILASGLFEIEPHWTWGFAAERARDRFLFDQYSISDVDEPRGLFRSDDRRLLSQIYTVRQSENSYLSVAALSFQSIRPAPGSTPNAFGIRPLEDDQTLPVIAPLVEFRFEPEQRIAGGRLRLRGSGVLLDRDASHITPGDPGVDSRRATVEGDWRRAFIVGPGVRLEPFAMARGDLYNTADLSATDTRGHTTNRALGVLGVDASYPFIRQRNGITTIIEPIVQLAVSPDIDPNPRIPNEDGLAFDFDETNLFEPNKFTGFDLYEGGQRMNLGVRTSVDWGEGRNARFIVGRSFRAEPDPMFPARTSLNQKSSDWVAGAEITPVAGLALYSRVRLDRDTLDLRKIEAGVDARLSRGAGYLRYMKQDQDYSGVPREDIEGAGEVFVTKRWGVSADAIRDLQTQTWRRRAAGVVYRDECLRFEVLYQRDNNPLLGERSSQSVVVRLTLATLGDAGYRNYANR